MEEEEEEEEEKVKEKEEKKEGERRERGGRALSLSLSLSLIYCLQQLDTPFPPLLHPPSSSSIMIPHFLMRVRNSSSVMSSGSPDTYTLVLCWSSSSNHPLREDKTATLQNRSTHILNR